MKMVEQHLPAERYANRQRPVLGDCLHVSAGLFAPPCSTQNDKGLSGCGQKPLQLVQFRFAGACFDRSEGKGARCLDLARQHILRQRDDHRAGAPGGGNRKSPGDEFRDAGGIVDFHHPFGNAAEKCVIIDLLEGFAVFRMGGDLPDEQDHRNGILHRDVNTGRGVGGTGAAGDETDAGLSGQSALAVGHHRGAAFLSADDGLDRRIVQRVQHGEIAFAGNAENTLYVVGFQRLDNQLSAGFHFPFFSSSARISCVCSPSLGEGRS